MSDYDDFEREQLLNDMNSDRQEKKAEAARMMEGFQALKQDSDRDYFNRKLAQKNKKYAERLVKDGLPPAKLQKLYAENPALYDEALDSAFKQFNRTVKDYRGKRRGQPGRQPASGQAPKQPAPETLTNARSKVETGGHLNEADEMDVLAAVLGSDFKV